MTTCALISAANEPARFSPTDGAWLRRAAARSHPARSGRNGDGTLDTPVSNVVSTLLAGRAFQPSGRENFIGAPAGA